MTELRWNVQHGTRIRGPMNSAELHAMARRGKIAADDLVWHDGMQQPVEASLLPALGEFFGQAAPVEVRPDYGIASTASAVAAPVAVAAPPADPVIPAPESSRPPVSNDDHWQRPERQPAAVIPLAYSNPSGHADGAVSADTISALTGTRPWVRFIGVLMMVFAGLNLLGALIAAVDAGYNMFAALALVMLMLIPTSLWLFPAFQLNRYANRINQLARSQSHEDLTQALRMQESFWRYVGISALVVVSIYGLIIIAMVVAFIAL